MKNYWMKFYFEDLDRDCRTLTLASRGAWVWIFGDLHSHGGERTLSIEQWSRVISATVPQTITVLREIIAADICDSNVTSASLSDALSQKSDAQIMIRCRRIAREAKSRENHNLRQAKYRSKRSSDAQSDAVVTPIDARCKMLDARNPLPPYENDAGKNGNGIAKFREVWNEYPPHRRKSENVAFDAWARLNPGLKLAARIMRAILTLKDSEGWLEAKGKYVPGFDKWLDSRGWESVQEEPPPIRPAGSDPVPGPGMQWERDENGELIHPLHAVERKP